MQARRLPGKTYLALACVLTALLCAGTAAALFAAAEAATQAKKQEKEPEKKEETKQGGGLFSGFKKTTGMEGREEKRATASAGAKGVGEGKEIGNATATSTDRSKVASMEAAKPGKEEMAAFLQEGKLAAARKGGGQ